MPLYEEGEARAIVFQLLEDTFDLSRADLLAGGLSHLDSTSLTRLQTMMHQLQKGVPLQQVVGGTFFCERWFRVSPDVLIPRPETEDLCRWIVQETPPHSKILDVGTGSGCIAITLAKDLNQPAVSAWDISSNALKVAQDNAKKLAADVQWMVQDALSPPEDTDIWDVVVSNPPYICHQEAETMHPNVLLHEPHLALFVPNEEPLLFYKAIAQYALKALKLDGKLYFETHSKYRQEVVQMLEKMGFDAIKTQDDCFGLPRFVAATKPLV